MALQESNKAKANDLLKARHAAVDRLIAAHEEEFHSLYEQEATARGVTYVRPETPESKARKELERLRSEFPEQFNQVAGVVVDDDKGDSEGGTPEGPNTSADGSTITG